MKLHKKVYSFIRQIPKGRVTTYGIVAKKCGTKSPRLVGRILHKNPDPKNIPCHRVVNFRGALAENFAFGGEKAQRVKLENEGVKFIGNRVDLKNIYQSN